MTASRVSWEEGSFVRDTLIYRLGILVRAVAIIAFADPKVRATYDAWLRQLQKGDSLKPAPPSQPLVESGFASGGKLQFEARREADEFLALFEHDDFQTVIGVGFDTQTMLMVEAHAYDDGLPAVGDIVVAQHPFADHIVMTKRVTACHDNQVWLGSDNLHVGADSRHFGPVAPALLRGRVTVCLGS